MVLGPVYSMIRGEPLCAAIEPQNAQSTGTRTIFTTMENAKSAA